MTKAQKTVTVDCPVCLSGNHFNLDEANREMTCEDCGFLLAYAAAIEGLTSGRCIICGNERFYFDSPLNLKFLGGAPRCYVCDATYEGIEIARPDDKYSYETADTLADSTAAKTLKERAARWH
jgi:hypothetical protein